MRKEQRVSRYDSARYQGRALELYKRKWPPKAIYIALQKECGEDRAPAFPTVCGWCSAWTRAKRRQEAGYSNGKASVNFRFLDVEVFDRAFQIYLNETEDPKTIREKLVDQFNGRTPKMSTIYQWRLRWRRAAARAKGEAPIDSRFKNPKDLASATGSTKMTTQRPLHPSNEPPLVCRRDGLPYILREVCEAWQTKWRIEEKGEFPAKRHLLPCVGCGNCIEELEG